MGHPTDYVGHIDIVPALNDAEITYLTAFAGAHWQICADGCCLTPCAAERFSAPVPWLRYVIDQLLKPGASASRSGRPELEGFTFDHRLDGVTVGCRQDNKELFAIKVTNNRVRTEVLRPADPRYLDLPLLRHEEVNERSRARRSRRQRAGASVIDLASRRVQQG